MASTTVPIVLHMTRASSPLPSVGVAGAPSSPRNEGGTSRHGSLVDLRTAIFGPATLAAPNGAWSARRRRRERPPSVPPTGRSSTPRPSRTPTSTPARR